MTKTQKCVVCSETVYGAGRTMCSNCMVAKTIIQRSALSMLALHGSPLASGICVDCGSRPATCRDHRHYASPLKVDYVCTPCNMRRGNALDLHDMIRKHRGLADLGDEPNEIDEAALQVPPKIPQNLPAALDEFERTAITSALAAAKFNKTQAAKLLGISFRGLRYRIEKLGIE